MNNKDFYICQLPGGNDDEEWITIFTKGGGAALSNFPLGREILKRFYLVEVRLLIGSNNEHGNLYLLQDIQLIFESMNS